MGDFHAKKVFSYLSILAVTYVYRLSCYDPAFASLVLALCLERLPEMPAYSTG